MYLEGSDQHRGWFQSSLLLSLAGNGAPPYKSVLTHGFMVDAEREKISKSKQGQAAYEKPQTSEAYVKKWGADIVRLWVASQDFRNDLVVSEERISKVAETYRGLRNTLRYQLSNLYDLSRQHRVADAQSRPAWIDGSASEFSKSAAAVRAMMPASSMSFTKSWASSPPSNSRIYHDVIATGFRPFDSSRRRSTFADGASLLGHGLCRRLPRPSSRLQRT
jgi:isoleucyl-tRNA synthetase